jgi:tetratricopeptide (TPR) repeat protein
MNRKQRRITQSQNKPRAVLTMRGRAYTIEEAGALAIRELTLRNLQSAADIYSVILATFPDYAEAYNNRGVALQQMKQYEGALANYDRAIDLKPDYLDAHINRANTLQALQRYARALPSYDRAIALNPSNATVHNSRGFLLQEMRQYSEALTSYDRAIALKPDYAVAYNNRGVCLRAMNRNADALANYDKAVALRPDYAMAYNGRGVTLQEMNRDADALASYDKAIALKPDYAEAYNNRGLTLREMKRHAEALTSYDKAIALRPDYAIAHNNRGLTLHELKLYADALVNFDKAIALNPVYAEAYNNRGATQLELKMYDNAIASCDKAITLKPDIAEAYQNRGVILVNKGDMKEAELMFLKALSLKPDLTLPLFSLTKIRKYQDADHPDIKAIRNLLNKPGAPLRDRDYLYFSLGKIFDDCGLYDDAFECYLRANQIRNASVAYDSDEVRRNTDRNLEVFSEEFSGQPLPGAPGASGSRAPLFIVGMPRSGTTLMAQILSNHRAIGTAGELPTITEFTVRLTRLIDSGVSYPRAAKYLDASTAILLSNEYEKRLRRDVGTSVPRVIDKSPLNFRHLGFIAVLFPKAQIIHCTRHPLDTGLSNYFQRFSVDYAYSFDLRNIGHFYGEYVRIMDHWRKVLPGKMIEVSYEDMIMNTEEMARRALDLLGLEWDERCLSPHTNPSAVETSSNWQVRQPIYKESVGRWRHYEKYLTPLIDAMPPSHDRWHSG